MQSAITDLFAGVPVSDLDASIDWYTRFFGRPPDSRVGEEILWEIDERAWLFIEPNASRAGTGRMGTRSRSPSRPTPRARHLDRPDPGLRHERLRRCAVSFSAQAPTSRTPTGRPSAALALHAPLTRRRRSDR